MTIILYIQGDPKKRALILIIPNTRARFLGHPVYGIGYLIQLRWPMLSAVLN